MCVCVSENTGSKMKAALIHILLHMHRHSSFSSRVHTVSFSNTIAHTHARQGGLRRQLGDAGEGVSPEFHCSSQRGIYVENLLDKKGVGNGGMKEERGGKRAFVGCGLAVSTSQLLGKGVRCSVYIFLRRI